MITTISINSLVDNRLLVEQFLFPGAVFGVAFQQRQRPEPEPAALALVDVHTLRLLPATDMSQRVVQQLVVATFPRTTANHLMGKTQAARGGEC